MVGDRRVKEMNEPLQKELEKTTGKSWFDMPATELTDERKMWVWQDWATKYVLKISILFLWIS